MKPQSPKKVSLNSHQATSTQNTSLPVQNCPSNLTNRNSNLRQVRSNNSSRIIFGQTNLISNKFEQIIYILNNEIDILMVSETKLDDSFLYHIFLCQVTQPL